MRMLLGVQERPSAHVCCFGQQIEPSTGNSGWHVAEVSGGEMPRTQSRTQMRRFRSVRIWAQFLRSSCTASPSPAAAAKAAVPAAAKAWETPGWSGAAGSPAKVKAAAGWAGWAAAGNLLNCVAGSFRINTGPRHHLVNITLQVCTAPSETRDPAKSRHRPPSTDACGEGAVNSRRGWVDPLECQRARAASCPIGVSTRIS